MSDNPYHNGGGGGGFMQSPYGGSQGQESPGGSKKRNNSTLRPVTARQVLDAEQVHQDADYSIDGYDVGQILLVGSVVNLSVTATNVSYTIGDGTGYVDVRRWLDSADEDTAKEAGVQQDKYVSVLGTIKTFNNKKHINANAVRLIEDMNEVSHHLLKAQYVSLTLKHPQGGAGGGGGGGAHAGHDAYSAGVVHNAGGNDQYAGLPPMQRRIMELVSRDTTDEGMHVTAITKQVGGPAESEAVMEAIETLMGDGQLFSTIDDLHVKST